MKRTGLVIAFALLSTGALAAQADSGIARLCGAAHVNEVASADDVVAYPAGFYVASLKQQVSLGDPRIMLTTNDAFYLCTRPAATPGMDAANATLRLGERTLKYLFVPVIRHGAGGAS